MMSALYTLEMTRPSAFTAEYCFSIGAPKTNTQAARNFSRIEAFSSHPRRVSLELSCPGIRAGTFLPGLSPRRLLGASGLTSAQIMSAANWAERFGVTPERLRQAVGIVGVTFDDAEREVGRQ
jgi:hypothetical protein